MLGVLVKSFHNPVPTRRQNGLKVSDFAPLLVDFKGYHGSEGANVDIIM